MTCLQITTLALLIAVAGVACDKNVEPGKLAATAQKPGEQLIERGDDLEPKMGAEKAPAQYHYSPFVVHLEGSPFAEVSFKDVGLARPNPTPTDPLLEAISESFAYKIREHGTFGGDSQVVYDERILDPDNHLFCGSNHLYVDVWHSQSPDRWGYSLWSGCGEGDNFAWKEVPATGDAKDLPDQVEPLTSSIVESLAEASANNCFQKTC